MPKIAVYPALRTVLTPLKDSFARLKSSKTGKNYARVAKVKKWGHGGIDIPGKEGDPLLAVWDGVVSFKPFGDDYGKQFTIIATGSDEGAFYAHCVSILVNDGQSVKAGEVVALLGATPPWAVTGPHLHFEVRARWDDWLTARNPYDELEAARLSAAIDFLDKA